MPIKLRVSTAVECRESPAKAGVMVRKAFLAKAITEKSTMVTIKTSDRSVLDMYARYICIYLLL